MLRAEKVRVNNTDWIKVFIATNHPPALEAMKQVAGARFNPSTRNWAVPYSNRAQFEQKMGDFLIVWEGEESRAGGIDEAAIPSHPTVPDYSVTYDGDRNIIASTGFKTTPWGEFQVKGFNALVSSDFLILADDAGLGN